MTEQEYLTGRLDDQIAWYDGKSENSQFWYKVLSMTEYILAAILVPLGFFFFQEPCLKFLVSLIGALIAGVKYYSGLNKYHENWIQYRTTCEILKHEKYLYLTRSGGYAGEKSFNQLVERCESIISSENVDWAQLHKSEPTRN